MREGMPADFQSGSLEDTTRDFTPHPRINLPPTSLQTTDKPNVVHRMGAMACKASTEL
ncbi:MAG: hypothetical protein NZ529_00705 [Cytophagaceae bacterium]|nr:hypothetical protein [Cytophagaceae bacterium]MDW8455284.1 hypothetical protein [Cytophagaceae bacterium]